MNVNQLTEVDEHSEPELMLKARAGTTVFLCRCIFGGAISYLLPRQSCVGLEALNNLRRVGNNALEREQKRI